MVGRVMEELLVVVVVNSCLEIRANGGEGFGRGATSRRDSMSTRRKLTLPVERHAGLADLFRPGSRTNGWGQGV